MRGAWIYLWLMAGLVLGCSPRQQGSVNSKAGSASHATLRLAASRWPPFTDTQDRRHLAIDVVEAALQRAGYASKTQIIPGGALPEVLLEGGFDGSPALWRSPDREQVLLFSESYFDNRLVLVGRADSDLSAQSFAELQGKKIGIVENYAYGPELEAATGPTFIKAATLKESLRGLLQGDLDYALADSFVAEQALAESTGAERERLRVGSHALLTRSLHFGLRKDYPDAARTIERFNQALAAFKRDGTLGRTLSARLAP